MRQGTLHDFFAHENQSYPPSISRFAYLCSGQKSDSLKILKKEPASPTEATPVVEALLVDGAADVNSSSQTGYVRRLLTDDEKN